MIDTTQKNSKEMDNALKAWGQAKARLVNERKKLNEKRRKKENRHKYLMGHCKIFSRMLSVWRK